MQEDVGRGDPRERFVTWNEAREVHGGAARMREGFEVGARGAISHDDERHRRGGRSFDREVHAFRRDESACGDDEFVRGHVWIERGAQGAGAGRDVGEVEDHRLDVGGAFEARGERRGQGAAEGVERGARGEAETSVVIEEGTHGEVAGRGGHGAEQAHVGAVADDLEGRGKTEEDRHGRRDDPVRDGAIDGADRGGTRARGDGEGEGVEEARRGTARAIDGAGPAEERAAARGVDVERGDRGITRGFVEG